MTNQLSDRELLEYAAKAVGIELTSNGYDTTGYYGEWRGLPQWEEWNPLTHDGDAFRLMVKLALDVCPSDETDPYTIVTDFSDLGVRVKEFSVNGDHLANTRRAIVRTAARIGRGIREFPSADEIQRDWGLDDS